jgi:predicted Zn finger-like uncharacterized protein
MIGKPSAAMPFQAHCPSCQTEYTLVDSLRGKYVLCEHCRQSFRAIPEMLEPSSESPARTELPPFHVTPPTASNFPRTILNSGEHPVKDFPAPPRQHRPASPGRVGKAGFPMGLVFIAFLAIRACVSLMNSSSHNSTRWDAPNPQVPKIPENFQFRMAKDKGIVVVPQGPNDPDRLKDAAPFFPAKDKDKGVAPGGS